MTNIPCKNKIVTLYINNYCIHILFGVARRHLIIAYIKCTLVFAFYVYHISIAISTIGGWSLLTLTFWLHGPLSTTPSSLPGQSVLQSGNNPSAVLLSPGRGIVFRLIGCDEGVHVYNNNNDVGPISVINSGCSLYTYGRRKGWKALTSWYTQSRID
jgi:hypothetical protein